MTKAIPAWVLLVAVAPAGAGVVVSDRLQHEVSLNPSGLVVIDNTAGNIEVTGGSDAKVVIRADRVIRADDGAALAEARQHVNRVVEGNDKTRVIRTLGPAVTPRWNAQVHYTVVVPRAANLKIVSTHTQRIRVAGLTGQVTVKSVHGPVVIDDVAGAVFVENINGDVILLAPRVMSANARLSSINGSIAVRTPPDAKFTWEAETVMGEARTAYTVRGGQFLTPTRFRGSVNSPAKVMLITETFGGNVLVMPHGAEESAARPVRSMIRQVIVPSPNPGVGPMMPALANRADVRLPLHQGRYRYETSIGNVHIDEIRGAARIVTGAGEVTLGAVYGHCDVVSYGGPLTLGDIVGPLAARTEAGNISVQRAREGGTIATGGGSILVQYSGGPIQLSSRGGDITLRQAMGAVTADTRSGDITVAFDRSLKTERMVAKTGKGNIMVTLPGRFGVDIDAEVITSDPTVNSIRSDFQGLSIQREQVGGKTRIRATGKINGGGERIELQAMEGGIYIALDAPRVSPMVPH
ncbi:MAG TPA: hypothetical protein VNA04_06875 [Thermoanaerobaculia bacterium]|nr:hypothetical protein [Thermoanaerobaculia bacterium]